MGRIIFERSCHGEWKLTRWAYIARENIGESIARLPAVVPRLHESLHLAEPRHCIGIATHDHCHKILVDSSQTADELVLEEVEFVVTTVSSLAILEMVLVQTTDIDDEIGFLSLLNSLFAKLSLLCLGHLDSTSIHRRTALVALSIFDLGNLTVTLLKGTQWRHLILSLEFRRSASLGELASSIVAHYKDSLALEVSLIERKKRCVVLEQYYTLLGNLTASVEMSLCVHAA